MAKRKASELTGLDQQPSYSTHNHGNVSLIPSKRRRKPDDEQIDKINKLPIHEFQTQYIHKDALVYSQQRKETAPEFRITFKAASELTQDELNTCFELIEVTSRQDYESSSWGWHPKRKKREMREGDMRYLLVRPIDNDEHSIDSTSDQVQGFASFMLTLDSTPSVPVLYIYEIHLAASLRKLGLGAHLMHVMESIAASVGVEKVMLTCFVSNQHAHNFYRERGFRKDASSPRKRKTRSKVIRPDYVIMSKAVNSEFVDNKATIPDDHVRCNSHDAVSRKAANEHRLDGPAASLNPTHAEAAVGAGSCTAVP